MINKDNSPFTPGNPVPVEFFEGRLDKLQEAIRYINQSASGRLENIFLTGERGIGKSSFASFICHLMNRENDFLCVHTFLGQAQTLEEMVRLIFEQLLKAAQDNKWFSKIRDLFGKYINQVGLFGISISFAPPKKELTNLVRNFPEALSNIISKTRDDIGGILIVLDDIDGLAEKAEFANWYKSVSDQISTSRKVFPVSMMMIGLPEKRETMYKLQLSLMRIFRIIEIEKMTDDEVGEFLQKAFNSVKIEIEKPALQVMIDFAGGLPTIMHEIGDAVYWLDQDNIISEDDAWIGILEAAERIRKKYLDPGFYRSISNENYKSLLGKLAKKDIGLSFRKSEVKKALNEKEVKVFNNFVRKLENLQILDKDTERGPGSYKFVNNIYPVYIGMEAVKASPRRKYKTRK